MSISSESRRPLTEEPSLARDGDNVAISVKDNGIGIAPEMMPRLFDLFSQATPALHRSEGGLGIGLSLVKAFVEKHGGTVEARSEGHGKGSEFVVRLPIGHASSKQRGKLAAEPTLAGKRMRVLVADDNLDSTQTCSMLLELWGHEVRVANSGAEALEIAEQFQPEVVLLDIGMPDLSGYQVAGELRASPWGKQATLIAVTGWGQADDKQQASDAGFDHHLTKPVEPLHLQPLLESLR